MTEGMIKVLEALGTSEQKEKYLPLVVLQVKEANPILWQDNM